jgi:hypothetical protein
MCKLANEKSFVTTRPLKVWKVMLVDFEPDEPEVITPLIGVREEEMKRPAKGYFVVQGNQSVWANGGYSAFLAEELAFKWLADVSKSFGGPMLSPVRRLGFPTVRKYLIPKGSTVFYGRISEGLPGAGLKCVRAERLVRVGG